jgi:capsule polysaccharide export protein KpsE/RkpR
MGVERAVTRWHIQQQQIQQEITTLEAKLALLSSCLSEASRRAALDEQETDSIRQQLTDAQKKLLALGPCPKPMMG